MTVHPWERDLGPVEAEVQCQRELHVVAWDPDLGLSFPDHHTIDAELALVALGADAAPGCVEVARAWSRIEGTDAALRGWRPPDDDTDTFAAGGDHLASLVGVRPSAVAGSLRALRSAPRGNAARPLAGFAAHLDHLVDQQAIPRELRACLGVSRLAQVAPLLEGSPPEPGRDPAASDARQECRVLAEAWARWALVHTAPEPARARRLLEVTYDGPADASLRAMNAGRDLVVRLDVGVSWVTSVVRRDLVVVDGVLILDVDEAGDADALEVSAVRWERTRTSHRAFTVDAVVARSSGGWRLR